MKKSSFARFRFTIVTSTLVATAMATVAFAAPPSSRIDAFLGLWEGIDGVDGSVVRVSLTDINDDGTIEVTQTENFYSFCHSMGAAFSLGHGVEVGTATVAQKRDALKVDIQLLCIDDNNVQHEQNPVALEYPLRARGKNLVIPAFPNSLPIVLHRLTQ